MKETAVDVVKITPPAAAVAMSLQEWVLVTSLVYTLLIIFDKFYPGVLPKVGHRVWAWIKGLFKRV